MQVMEGVMSITMNGAMRRRQEREVRRLKRRIRRRELLAANKLWKQERAMLKRDAKMQKWKEKRWKRINKRIEQGVSALVILATILLSVLEVLEKGDRKFVFGKGYGYKYGNLLKPRE